MSNDEQPLRKGNRQRVQQADRRRPIVHGAVPYFGHRPRAKDERRRQAEVVRKARKR